MVLSTRLKMEALSDRVVALEVTQSAVRAVAVGVERQMPVLHRAIEVPIPTPRERPQEGSPLYTACQSALGDLGDEVVVSSVDPTDVLVRQLKIELAKDREIEAALDFQIEPLLPFPVEEGVLDHMVLERDKEGATLVVLSLPNERMQAHLQRMRAGGVEPERTSCPQAALATLLYRLLPSQETQGVLHLGDESTTCMLVRQGKVVASRAIACGVMQLKEAAPDLPHINFQVFDTSPALKLHHRAEALRAEITRAFFAMGENPPQIFLAGEFGQLWNFEVYLARALELPLVPLPERSPFCSPLGDVTKFAVPLGLALGALPLRTPRIDFRKKEHAYPRPWRRLQRRMLIYFGLTVLVAGGVLLMGRAMRGRRMHMLKSEYDTLSHYVKEVFDQAPPPCPEDPAAVVRAAQTIGNRFDKLPSTYPLLPTLPRVSDVLAWFSTHPQLVECDPETGATVAKVHLESLQYVMVSHPTPKRPKARYRVRVDLEFRADSPTVARSLHDALLEPNPFLDPSEEVKWVQAHETYRTSFFLKDATYYPAAT